MIETVFLDAGGVLVNPNWDRVAATLGRHGVRAWPQLGFTSTPPASRKTVSIIARS